MTNTQSHLEDVRRAIRLGAGLAVAGSVIVLLAGIAAGLSAAAALGLATLALPTGVLSGGFGLAIRATASPTRPSRPVAPVRPAPSLRIPQPR
ncbi:MAG: hypothetical protein AABM29_04500 [Actinomycetota bacterium]